MEALLDELLKNINDIIAGVPLRWEDVREGDRKTVLTCALHCCLNGPVGVNKETTFPVVGITQINKLVRVSNSSWRGFCEVVAKHLVNKKVVVECNSMRLLNTYWPLKAWPKVVVM